MFDKFEMLAGNVAPRSRRRPLLATSASLMALFAADPGLAQQAAAPGANSPEIVVTAQKREETLQKVPISVAVLTGAALERSPISDTAQALGRVTSVSILPGLFGGSQVTIRGVATGSSNFAGSAPVAFYLDAAPIGLVKSAILPDANVYDLARIEVLRGPQGTLYGANALNGVVRILTNDPNLEKFEFKGRGTWSSTQSGGENYRGDMAVNIPIIDDRLAVRAVVGAEDRAGWIDHPGVNDANSGKTRNARLKVAAKPTDDLTIDASAWISRAKFKSLPNGQKDLTNSLEPEPYSLDFDVYNLKAAYDLGFATLTNSASSAKFTTNNAYNASPGVFLDTSIHSQVYSDELVLSSNGSGPWRWSAGGFYRSAADHNLQTLVFLPAPLDWTERSRSFAFFGEATRRLADDRIEITGGLRYFQDRSTQQENTPGSGDSTQPLNRTGKTFNAVTPRAVITWFPDRNTTIYASYSQGFRSGFSQTPIALLSAPTLSAVNPDRLYNYELGMKGSLLSRKLHYEMAVFYIDWKKIQLPLTVPVPGTDISASAVVNGAEASGPGAEISLDFQATRRLTVGGSFGYNGLTFDKNVMSGGYILYPKGSRNPTASKFTANGHVDYSFPLGQLKTVLSASANYLSKQLSAGLGATGAEMVSSDNVLIARASATFNAPAGWSVSAFVDNLTNTHNLYSRTTISVDRSIPPQPRTIGIQLEFKM